MDTDYENKITFLKLKFDSLPKFKIDFNDRKNP